MAGGGGWEVRRWCASPSPPPHVQQRPGPSKKPESSSCADGGHPGMHAWAGARHARHTGMQESASKEPEQGNVRGKGGLTERYARGRGGVLVSSEGGSPTTTGTQTNKRPNNTKLAAGCPSDVRGCVRPSVACGGAHEGKKAELLSCVVRGGWVYARTQHTTRRATSTTETRGLCHQSSTVLPVRGQAAAVPAAAAAGAAATDCCSCGSRTGVPSTGVVERGVMPEAGVLAPLQGAVLL